jgi:enoyl-CoA hydratase/carnithine racemase
MTGERIGADRLHALGIVNRVVPQGTALEEALAFAQGLNERAPNALASIKALLSEAGGVSLHAHLAAERDHFVRNLHHPNAGIGIAAFLAKSKPQY